MHMSHEGIIYSTSISAIPQRQLTISRSTHESPETDYPIYAEQILNSFLHYAVH